MPEDKTNGCTCGACDTSAHLSDCAVHNGPALALGPCDCGVEGVQTEFNAMVDGVLAVVRGKRAGLVLNVLSHVRDMAHEESETHVFAGVGLAREPRATDTQSD